MDWVETINTSIEYMENHLREEITLADIAKNACNSIFHFHRSFSLFTGMTPMEYLRRRRLSEAGADLVCEDKSITEIAQRYCFSSLQSFAKAFKRFHNCSPNQARKGKRIRYMNRYVLRVSFVASSNINCRIEETGATDIIVCAKDFNTATSDWEIPAFCTEFFTNKGEQIPAGHLLGVYSQPNTDRGDFRYGIGCRASDVDGLPEGFEAIHIPKHTWAIFRCAGTPDGILETWKQIYSEWLPSSEYDLVSDYSIEYYLPEDPVSGKRVSEIRIPVTTNGQT